MEETNKECNDDLKKKNVERDFIKNLLYQKNIINYDNIIIDKLLYYVHGHVTTILEDADSFAKHADRENVEIDDVKLALKLHKDRRPFTTDKRQIALEMSKEINSENLPIIYEFNALMLPPEKYALFKKTYKLNKSDSVQEDKRDYPERTILTTNNQERMSSFLMNSSSQGSVKFHNCPETITQSSNSKMPPPQRPINIIRLSELGYQAYKRKREEKTIYLNKTT